MISPFAPLSPPERKKFWLRHSCLYVLSLRRRIESREIDLRRPLPPDAAPPFFTLSSTGSKFFCDEGLRRQQTRTTTWLGGESGADSDVLRLAAGVRGRTLCQAAAWQHACTRLWSCMFFFPNVCVYACTCRYLMHA